MDGGLEAPRAIEVGLQLFPPGIKRRDALETSKIDLLRGWSAIQKLSSNFRVARDPPAGIAFTAALKFSSCSSMGAIAYLGESHLPSAPRSWI